MTLRASLVIGIALGVRAVAVVLGWSIPPVDDGVFYDTLATRLAEGRGFTWMWPDGAITPVAHYPIGYPAVIAVVYAAFGHYPGLAMICNAFVGAAGAWATYDLLVRSAAPDRALLGGVVAALHPALVAYTPALMTEGVTASLVLVGLAVASRQGPSSPAATGIFLGFATLMRPQCALFAPAFGWIASRQRRVRAAVIATALTALVCLPWTVRNCLVMDRCVWVSANAGWNLAIGTQTTDGRWHEIQAPEACRDLFGEAAKDACFGQEARIAILSDVGSWVAKVPAKVRATFDYVGAAPGYLGRASPNGFPFRWQVALLVVETLACRGLLALALGAVMTWPGPRSRLRALVGTAGLFGCVTVPGAIGYVLLAAAIALLGKRKLAEEPLLAGTGAVIGCTAFTHALFFGAGRYGLAVVPFVTALAFARPKQLRSAT